MQVKISEIADRWTILRMKARLSDHFSEELNTFENELKDAIKYMNKDEVFRMLRAIAGLAEANGRIWENEAAIRQEFNNDQSAQNKSLSLSEVGRRALVIRNFNKFRIDSKTEIDKLVGEQTDQKIDHMST